MLGRSKDYGELVKNLEDLTGGKVVGVKCGTKGIVFIVDTGASMPKYVAYKTSMDAYSDHGLNRFIREARKWFSVSGHPLVLTPYYIVSFNRRPLICMRYMETSLEEYLKAERKLDIIESLVLVIQVTKGLIYIRSRGTWAHQDLKPANILMEDLSKIYWDYPGKNVHPSLRWRVRIADFGLADAWREVGAPRGTFPYMAPEQYIPKFAPKEVREEVKRMPPEEFNPDIFALGVILTEVLTGLHPCGKLKKVVEKEWKWKEWERWAKSGKRVIKLDKDLKVLEKLIKTMLSPDPKARPSLEEIYNTLMNILRSKDEATWRQLGLVLEYYDKLAEHYIRTFNWIDDLMKLASLPKTKEINFVIGKLKEEKEKIKKPSNPHEAVLLCKLNRTIGKLLLKKDKSKHKEEIKRLGIEIVDIIENWKNDIKVHHLYLPLEFKDQHLIELKSLRDFEVHAELMGYGVELLKAILNSEMDDFFDKSRYSSYVKSVYHFINASILRVLGKDLNDVIKELDKSIELTPNIAAPYYFKALWIYQWITLMKEEISNKEICRLLRIALNSAKQASDLVQEWNEPTKLLRELRDLSCKV